MSRCATVGCRNEATERIIYKYPGTAQRDTDDVCTPCADEYEHRPALRDFTRMPLDAGEGIQFYTITPADVGRAHLRLWDQTWSMAGVLGRILPGDVGKRLYRVPMHDRSGYILQVENNEQRAIRLRRGE